MKSLIRMYHHQGRGVIFYENAAVPTRRKHAAISAIPMPLDITAEAPAYFRVSPTSFKLILLTCLHIQRRQFCHRRRSGHNIRSWLAPSTRNLGSEHSALRLSKKCLISMFGFRLMVAWDTSWKMKTNGPKGIFLPEKSLVVCSTLINSQ